MMERKDYLKQKLSKSGLVPTDEQAEMLLSYYEMLVEKNKVMNLTAITEFDEVVDKHFADSLSIVMASEDGKITKMLEAGCRIMDLGTGAGFPGIPLKIMFPNLKMTLMDSLNKRLLFLDEVIAGLGLKNISTCHGRAEELARKDEYREKFDLVVSRAVANLSLLSEYALGFVKPGGLFIPYKAGGCEDEISAAEKAIAVMGGRLINTARFTLPETDYERVMPVIKKHTHTPAKYPRNGKKAGAF